MKVDLSHYDNSWYSPRAGLLKRLLWLVVQGCFFINPLNPSSSFKIFLLRLFGARIGSGVMIKPSVRVKYPWLLEVGNYAWIGEDVWIDNLVKVSIGDNCCLSQGALLLTGNHNYKRPTFDLMVGEVTLEEGVWIGAKAVVCPGVVCESHSMLTVGSVATKKLESFGIYQGNPARLVKKRMEDEVNP